MYKLLKCYWLPANNFLNQVTGIRFLLKSGKIVKHDHDKT